MKKMLVFLIILVLSFVLIACESESNDDSSSETMHSEQTYLFEAEGMDVIQLTGQQILEGEEANMTVKISEEISIDFHLSRDNPNGTQMYAIYEGQALNLAVNYISPDVLNDDEAIPTYIYQMSCFDFYGDGSKELVIACGNKLDALSLFIFEVNVDFEEMFIPVNYILGYDTAYLNENNEICVPSPQGTRVYTFNVKAQDPLYARASGPVKVTLNYGSDEEIEAYENAQTFVINEEGLSLLLKPTENLTNFTVHVIEYDAASDKFIPTETLYSLPAVSPEAPVVIKFYLPDFPSIGFTYYDEDGVGQTFGIGESLRDGSLYMFQLDSEAKG